MQDLALGVHVGDAGRGVVEDALQADIGVVAAAGSYGIAAVEHQRTRWLRFAFGVVVAAMDDAHRQAGAAGGCEVEVENLGHGFARTRLDAGDQPGRLLADEFLKGQLAVGGARQVDAQPVGEGGIDVGDAAAAFSGEKAGGRAVEEVDDVLQTGEGLFLAAPVGGYVGEAPQGVVAAEAGGDGRNRYPRPHRFIGSGTGGAGAWCDTEFLRQLAPVAGRLGKAIDLFGNLGIAGIEILDAHQPSVPVGEGMVGSIAIDRAAVAVGDHATVADRIEQGIEEGALARQPA